METSFHESGFESVVRRSPNDLRHPTIAFSPHKNRVVWHDCFSLANCKPNAIDRNPSLVCQFERQYIFRPTPPKPDGGDRDTPRPAMGGAKNWNEARHQEFCTCSPNVSQKRNLIVSIYCDSLRTFNVGPLNTSATRAAAVWNVDGCRLFIRIGPHFRGYAAPAYDARFSARPLSRKRAVSRTPVRSRKRRAKEHQRSPWRDLELGRSAPLCSQHNRT